LKTYANKINTLLKPDAHSMPLVLDLFAGCGGLALGFEAQGFPTLGFEMDADCCATYKHNLNGDCLQVKLDADYKIPKAQVVIGARLVNHSVSGGIKTVCAMRAMAFLLSFRPLSKPSPIFGCLKMSVA